MIGEGSRALRLSIWVERASLNLSKGLDITTYNQITLTGHTENLEAGSMGEELSALPKPGYIFGLLH
jgi:hypothetical protein